MNHPVYMTKFSHGGNWILTSDEKNRIATYHAQQYTQLLSFKENETSRFSFCDRSMDDKYIVSYMHENNVTEKKLAIYGFE